MNTFNQWAIERFNSENLAIDPDTISRHLDRRLARLYTHLDLQVIRRWILPELRVADPIALDMGAGRGRMTGHLAEIARQVIAVEPYDAHYDVLCRRFHSSSNVLTRNATLGDFAATTHYRFDMIYAGGVVCYFDLEGAVEAVAQMKGMVAPGGFVLIHEYGKESHSSTTQEGIILRSPAEMQEIFDRAGLECTRWRRAYPPNLIWYLVKRWPSSLTKKAWDVITAPASYPLWELATAANLPHSQTSYFVYLLKPRN